MCVCVCVCVCEFLGGRRGGRVKPFKVEFMLKLRDIPTMGLRKARESTHRLQDHPEGEKTRAPAIPAAALSISSFLSFFPGLSETDSLVSSPRLQDCY